jgi:hypothetical protein
MQSRVGSLIESCASTLIGFGVALLSQLVIFPLYGVHVPLSTNLAITVWFTFISVARSYCVRRFFNAWLTRQLNNKGVS